VFVQFSGLRACRQLAEQKNPLIFQNVLLSLPRQSDTLWTTLYIPLSGDSDD
jgi:hypothetical protein